MELDRKKLSSDENIQRPGWDPMRDPYTDYDPDKHLADCRYFQVNVGYFYRHLVEAMKNHLLSDRDAGERTASPLEQCMIKRTYASRIPIDNPTTIRAKIPSVIARTLEAPLSVHEIEEYSRHYLPLIKKFAKKDTEGQHHVDYRCIAQAGFDIDELNLSPLRAAFR